MQNSDEPQVTLQWSALPGLTYVDSFITPSSEAALLSGVAAHPRAWKQLSNRSLQNWGGLPHAKGMIPTPLPTFLTPLCAHLVSAGVFPVSEAPNHALVNRYRLGQGISPHEDGPAYRPRAAVVSLQASIVMDFYCKKGGPVGERRVPDASLLLRQRSLVVIEGDVYSTFYHAIAQREIDVVDGTVLNAREEEFGTCPREERTSLTIRTSCKTIRNPLLTIRR